jgi:putative transposase
VDWVLGQAEEHLVRQCALRRRGYDLEKVAEIYGIKVEEFIGRGRQEKRVSARSLFCFWAARQLGNSLTSLAVRLRMSPAGVGYAVQRGKAIAYENGYQLVQ